MANPGEGFPANQQSWGSYAHLRLWADGTVPHRTQILLALAQPAYKVQATSEHLNIAMTVVANP